MVSNYYEIYISAIWPLEFVLIRFNNYKVTLYCNNGGLQQHNNFQVGIANIDNKYILYLLIFYTSSYFSNSLNCSKAKLELGWTSRFLGKTCYYCISRTIFAFTKISSCSPPWENLLQLVHFKVLYDNLRRGKSRSLDAVSNQF